MAADLQKTLFMILSCFSVVLSVPFLRWKETSLCSNSCSEDRPLCDCDPLCYLFGECCVDSENVAFKDKRAVDCEFMEGVSVFVVSTCDSAVNVPDEIKEQCHTNITLNQSSDPVNSVPVTSIDTQITYRNYHCSLCNGDSNVVRWRMGARFSYTSSDHYFATADENFLRNEIAYIPSIQRWGILYDGIISLVEIHPKPGDVEARRCFRGFKEISSCPPDWEDERVRQICALYRDTVYANFQNYKNKYCAKCHGVPEESLKCRIQRVRTSPYIKGNTRDIDVTPSTFLQKP